MTTSNPTVIFDNTTDASFRAWTQAVSTALQAVGLVKTADTGQIDFGTVTSPTGNNVAAGYEIYRFNDALQATRPVFFKLEYGRGAGSGQPSMWFTIGSGSNGAGTINSALQTVRRQFYWAVNTNTQPAYFSGDGSYLTFVVPTSSYFFLTIDRTRSSLGVATGDGLSLCGNSTGTGGVLTEQVLSFVNQASTSGAYGTYAYPGSGFGTSVVGADAYFFPRLVPLPKMTYDLSLMLAYTVDVANLVPLTISNYGASHVYMPYTGFNPIATSNTAGAQAILVRYE